MECLRSFNLHSEFNTVGPFNVGSEVKIWTTGTENYWAFQADDTRISTFNIQGFKNIDVYGIELVGSVGTNIADPNGGCIASDWTIQISINGFVPTIGGHVIGSNFYSITTDQSLASKFSLGRFNSKFMLASPIMSPATIVLNRLKANGVGAQSAANLNIQSLFNIIVYYKFQSEELALL
jgi:hypothetical protein